MKYKLLSNKNLDTLPSSISRPGYDRTKLQIGIVHIGVGGFHRSHQAFYTHKLLEQLDVPEWGICGVGLLEGDQKMYDVLKHQDGLYTLIIKHADGTMEPQVIGSIVDFLLAKNDPQAVINRMAHPHTKMVSLTITEGGYNFNPFNEEFDFGNPDVQHDLKYPQNPKTVYGFLTASLKKRYQDGLRPFTIMSCDNIQQNGDMARDMLVSFAKKQDMALGKWIEKKVSFPNSMVDRITPVTTPSEIDYLKHTHNIYDQWPVTCEPFVQWVIEDVFSDVRPPYEEVEVQFVPDVTPYEKIKLRLLNAGHSVVGILGALHGYRTIDACMEDELFRTYLRAFLDKEASPMLDNIPGLDLNSYKDSITARFANPNIGDTVSRICSESSAKLPKFLIPTLRENLKRRGSIKYATLVIAAWCYYSDKRINKNLEPLEVIDVRSQELREVAAKTQTNPSAFIKQVNIFGNLAKNERFKKAYVETVKKLYEVKDIRDSMQSIL